MLGGEFFRIFLILRMISLLRKALLGRRASLPVDWANGGPKTAVRGLNYDMIPTYTPEAMKKTLLPSLELAFW